MHEITSGWYGDHAYSFGGKYRAYREYPKTGKKVIEDSFKSNNIYTRYKQFKRLRKFNPVIVFSKRSQVQSDVCFFPEQMVKDSGGYKYLLVIIDVFTKFSWVYPLKSIKGEVVAEVIKKYIKKEKPKNFTTDGGKEFSNKFVKTVLSKAKVKHYVTRTQSKASIAERYILTIQRLIYQIFDARNIKNWVDVLNPAVKIYHSRKHGTIKMSPIEAEKEENQVSLSRIHDDRIRKHKTKKPKFKVGEMVRIALIRSKFGRGYTPSFSEEVWKVAEVKTNLSYPRYIVQDLEGEELSSVLNENELVSYTPKDGYKIEKILKRRTKRWKKNVFCNV